MTGVIRNVFSCRGNWKGCSERRRSGKQERSCPGAVAALVEHAIVEPVRIARPELDAVGPEAIAAPERRARDRGASGEFRAGLTDPRLERRPRVERIALRRRPRADLEFARPG